MAETSSDRRLARIKAIEARWGKDFMEVMADLHDHVFGTTPQKETEKPEPEEEPDDEETVEEPVKEPVKAPQPSPPPPPQQAPRSGFLGGKLHRGGKE